MHHMQLRAMILASAAAFAPGAVTAQEFPARAVRIIVPFPPGGVADILDLRVE